MHNYDDLIAYFSMEIGLQEPMPTYSGGLGILAGDTLKSLADLGMDVIAVTLLSRKGYFYQKIDDSGWQHESDNLWSINDFMKKISEKVEVEIEGRKVFVAAWEHILLGERGKRIKVLFLDTDLEENSPEDRKLTDYLYGGDLDYRLKQEIILGIGGVRFIRKLNYHPKKFHMNEGHAAFLTLELYKEQANITSREGRIQAVKEKCSFTTHTPVPAGHDAFDEEHVKKVLGSVFLEELRERFCENKKFSMTLLAMTFSSYINSVAMKHQQVSKNMFPQYEIDYITNGVHAKTWINPYLGNTLDKHIPSWKTNTLDLRNALRIPLSEIKDSHAKAKKDLIDHVNNHANAGFDYDIFTIGFARRATAYKRAELLFRDIERLKRINNEKGNIQIVYAGKAHPRDNQGKEIIKHLHEVIKSLYPEIKVVFVENYNMHLSKIMTSGCDVWLNTPKRPLEASGTSGMKAAMNGVPSLSILDGWWIEGCIEGVTGWAIGAENITLTDENKIDDSDANDLYLKLENEIVQTYYNNPDKYAEIMRFTIAINGSYFNTNRMAKQYLVRAYARNQNLN